jgi:hypothetical protein
MLPPPFQYYLVLGWCKINGTVQVSGVTPQQPIKSMVLVEG